MSYNPTTDFLALLRSTSGGVRTEQMPGLDYTIAALARAGLITLFVGQTAPTVNPATTVWFKPAMPSSSAEGAIFLFNSTTSSFQTATPTLWSNLIAGPIVSLIPPAGTAAPLMDAAAAVGTSAAYSREDHVHPTDTTRAPLASPVFTGNPQAPTATLGDNDTSIATTAFVIANGGLPPPIGSILPYAGTAAPSSSWAIANGSAFSRTGATAALFAVLGITFGAGDGVTTANLPDLRGRVVAGVDAGANRLSTATMSSQALAGVGGLEAKALVTSNIPAGVPATGSNVINVNPNNSTSVFVPFVNAVAWQTLGTTTGGNDAAGSNGTSVGTTATMTGTNTINVASTNGAQTATALVQPTIELNYIIRIS
jgi:microcystin-dependent protein